MSDEIFAFYVSLSLRGKCGFLLLLCLSLVVLFKHVFYEPILQSKQTYLSKIETLKTEVLQLQESDKQFKYKENILTHLGHMKYVNSTNVFSLIRRDLSKNNLRSISIKPVKKSSDAGFDISSFYVVLLGDYLNLMQWMQDLLKTGTVFSFSNMTLVPENGRESKLRLSLEVKIYGEGK